MSWFRFRVTSVPVICPKRGVNMFVLTVFLPCQFKRGVHVFVLKCLLHFDLKVLNSYSIYLL